MPVATFSFCLCPAGCKARLAVLLTVLLEVLLPASVAQGEVDMATARAASIPSVGGDACIRIPTGLAWIPNWLYVRTRLAAALWGDRPLTLAEAAAFVPLAAGRALGAACPLGSMAVRLALRLRQLDVDAVGLTAAADAGIATWRTTNLTGMSADWSRLRKQGFSAVLRSGWPVFELLRRLQAHLLGTKDTRAASAAASGGHRLSGTAVDPYALCDDQMRPDEWAWIQAYPQSMTMLPKDMVKSFRLLGVDAAGVQDTSRAPSICALAWATHYLIAAGNVYLKPGMGGTFYDDARDVVEDPSWSKPWSDMFLRKAERYLHDFASIMSSRWPILVVLGQLTATAMFHAPDLAYLRPFLTGWAVAASDEVSRYAIVEAGAHDGHESIKFAVTCPDAEVWAFEAHPRVFEALQEKVRNCGAACAGVRTQGFALGAEDKESVAFFANLPSEDVWAMPSSSLYEPTRNFSAFSSFSAVPMSIRVMRLETIAAQTNMPPIRYLDLDAEGAELDILRGGSSLLQSVLAMKVEFRDDHVALFGVPLWNEVRHWLESRGFVHILRSSSDALFVRRDLALI